MKSPLDNPRAIPYLIAAHAGMGLLFSFSRAIPTLYGIGVLAAGLLAVLARRNKDGAAHLFAGYLVGLEIMLRMARAGLFHEYAKYAIVLLLSVAILVERKKRPGAAAFVWYFLLLLPSVLYTDAGFIGLPWRQVVSANLSGPLSLAVAGAYFSGRKMNAQDFRRLSLMLIMPLFSAAAFVAQHVVGLEKIYFTTESNKQLSGGFGPNQVATAFGMAMLVVIVNQHLNLRLLRAAWMDRIAAVLFLGFGMITFSRGGILAAITAYACGFAVGRTKAGTKAQSKYAVAITAVVAIIAVWFTLNRFTEGMLEKRWQKEFATDKQPSFTHRRTIAKIDYLVFRDHPIVGAGIGMSKPLHRQYGISYDFDYATEASPHTEFTRLLAEHGLLGVSAWLVVMIAVAKRLRKEFAQKPGVSTVAFFSLAVLTMSHSAMRMSIPGFFFGLAFAEIVNVPVPAILARVKKAPAATMRAPAAVRV